MPATRTVQSLFQRLLGKTIARDQAVPSEKTARCQSLAFSLFATALIVALQSARLMAADSLESSSLVTPQADYAANAVHRLFFGSDHRKLSGRGRLLGT